MANPIVKVIQIALGYFAGKIFGWFYTFYILAIIAGLITGDEGLNIGFLPGLFLFLSFAILPFVVFAFFSIIIKKIKTGPDDLSIELKIILAPLIFFVCFIFFALFSPNTILGFLFYTIIKEFFLIILIGFIVLFFGIITLFNFFKLKPKKKKILTYFNQDLSLLKKILILLSFFIITYILLTIFNIIFNWDSIVNLLNTPAPY